MSRHGWTALGVGALMALAGAVVGHSAPLLIGLGLCLAVGVALGWVALGGGLDLERRLEPVRVEVGEEARSFLTVENRSRTASLPLPVVDRVGTTEVPLTVPTLRPSGSTELSYTPPTDRRGVFAVGPLTSLRGDPWQFVQRHRSHGDLATLLVYPRHQVLRPLPPSAQRSLEAPTSDSSAMGTQTFHQLRDYVTGDDRRMIHWRSYARTGNLVVRQHVDTSLPEVAVMLDLRPARHSEESFEEAVEIAASVLVLCGRQSFPVHLFLTDGRVLTAPPGGDPIAYFLDQLAAVEVDPDSSGDADLSRLVQAAASSVAGHRLLVVTGRPTPADMSSIAVLGRRCAQVVVVDAHPEGEVAGGAGVVVAPVRSAAEFAELWNQGLMT